MTSPAPQPQYKFLHPGFAEEYWDRGFVILRGVFAKEEIAELKWSFDRTYAEGMTHHSTWRHQNRVIWVQNHPKVGRFISGCQWQSWIDHVLDRVRKDPRMLAVLKPLIGDHINQSQNQMHWKTPGTFYTHPMHQDVRSRTPSHCFRELATSFVQTAIAVDRTWAGNGAMKVMPYSHKRGNLKLDSTANGSDEERNESVRRAGFDPKDLVDVEMDEGDMVAWGPFMIHGGGINTTTDSYRRTYINGYVKTANCDRGQPTWDHGKPVPLTIPAMIQYEQLYTRPEPHYPEDLGSMLQRD